ncbi:DUF4391 domain-containing protein [uncultured Deefgea sp.]|uniref:DUF4391 domain-containing protein n=1 Tax=uncultured Deefgea sp. TaxID=1304914 RepID=UPI0025988DFD|nr:DUF4391 domain-containing protein [uncultured Deefgea sp.]
MTAVAAKTTVADLIAAFALPEAALINKRVTKKLVLENACSTAADRKLINETIEDIQWVAALKPSTIGVPEYQDEQRSYLELAILTVTVRQDEQTTAQRLQRLIALLHRAIPYPVLLILAQGEQTFISSTHIRSAHNAVDKIVLDGELLLAAVGTANQYNTQLEFLQSLNLSLQPREHLHALYSAWMECLSAWQIAIATGSFTLSSNPEQSASRRAALKRCTELDTQINALRAAARKENQIARQVAINLEMKSLQQERSHAFQALCATPH